MTRHEFTAALKLLGLTQEEAARLLGVSGRRTIRRWITGERAIPGPVEAALTAWLGRGTIPRATRRNASFRHTLEAAARKRDIDLELPEEPRATATTEIPSPALITTE